MGIIGGADGPTAVFVTGVGDFVGFIITCVIAALIVAAVVIGIVLFIKRKRKK